MFVRAIEQLENLTMFGLTLPYGFSMSFAGSIKSNSPILIKQCCLI